MSPVQAQCAARLVGRLGRFGLSRHAIRRMRERDVTDRDIEVALQRATTAVAAGECWCFSGGLDSEGQPLTVVMVLARDVFVVTVF